MKITQSQNKLETAEKKYTRFVFTEDAPEVHRLIERENGTVEYRMGIGKFSKVTPRRLRSLIRSIVAAARGHRLSHVAVAFVYTDFPKLGYTEEWFWRTVAENLLIAGYEDTRYKSEPSKEFPNEIKLFLVRGQSAKKGIKRGSVIAHYKNTARDIANTPGGTMTPRGLAEAARRTVRGTKATIKILTLREIKKLKMGGLLAVGQGAKDKPRFIILQYKGGKPKEKPIVLVGKGITFDTGGLQIKPGMAMYEMHMDMSGGAAVIAAVACAAKLGIRKNVIGLVPAAENAVSSESMRPGDIYTAMNGKTVEVLHTDAEGRLVLADALTYAKRYDPKLVVDVATLTGAALVALGQHASVIMTKDRSVEDALRELGEVSGDYVWPLPLWDEYKQYVKGTHADISNIPAGDSRYGGTINGGTFLSHFTDKQKWVHIDMAPRMTAVPSDKLAKGATGEPMSLLVHIVESF